MEKALALIGLRKMEDWIAILYGDMWAQTVRANIGKAMEAVACLMDVVVRFLNRKFYKFSAAWYVHKMFPSATKDELDSMIYMLRVAMETQDVYYQVIFKMNFIECLISFLRCSMLETLRGKVWKGAVMDMTRSTFIRELEHAVKLLDYDHKLMSPRQFVNLQERLENIVEHFESL